MFANCHEWLMALQNCCKTFSERARTPAVWCTGWRVFLSERRLSWKSSSRSPDAVLESESIHVEIRDRVSADTPVRASHPDDSFPWNHRICCRGSTFRGASSSERCSPRTARGSSEFGAGTRAEAIRQRFDYESVLARSEERR